MSYKNLILIVTAIMATAFIYSCNNINQKKPGKTDWLKNWEKQNKTWRAMHLQTMAYDDIDTLKKYIDDVLVPMQYNAIVLTVDYDYDFQSYPQLSKHRINKIQARDLTSFCRQRGIRLIPMFNCVGHQSWLNVNEPLLLEFPEFDETPRIGYDNKGIYCREWCPLHPEVNKVVFALIDEIIDAFDADAFHVGMDEIFLCGYPPVDKKPWQLHTDWKPGSNGKDEPFPKGPQCPRCKGKDPADLIAKAINDYYEHLVKDKGLEMMMWSDRLLDGNKMHYGITEASKTGSHKAIDMIPKDIIMCDWHYGKRESYLSVDFFQKKGFRVLPSVWNSSAATYAFKKYSEKTATNKMLGILSCGWSVSPEQLLQAFDKNYSGEINKDAAGIVKSMKTIAEDSEQIDK